MPQVRLTVSSNVCEDSLLGVLTENGYCTCENCGGLEDENSAQSVRTSEYGGRRACVDVWCEDCADSGASVCDSCGDTVTDEHINRCHNGGYLCICQGCCEYGYFYCEGCGGLYPTDEMGYSEDWCFCSGCAPEQTDDDDDDDDDDDENVGNGPYPSGNGLGGYHGDNIRNSWTIPNGAVSVELELTTKHRNNVANALRGLYGCACERDGSLDDSKGMEIITKPQTYPEILNTLRDMLSSIKTMNTEARAWENGKGYGIHVNLDARLWADSKRAAYCAQFGLSNRLWLESVAGREQAHWASYKSDDSETVETSKCSASGIKSGGRMEVRIFRSTLKADTAIGYVALCKDIERFVDCDLFRRPKDLLFWLVRNGCAETRKLLADKLSDDVLSSVGSSKGALLETICAS